MYQIQTKPDKQASTQNGGTVTPVCTLADEWGEKIHIIVDDDCYVLLNGIDQDGFGISSWWDREALAALRTLPENPRDAVIVSRTEGRVFPVSRPQ